MFPLDRFPLITETGRRRLLWLEEHPHAPRYTHPGCDRVTPAGLRRAAAYAAEIKTAPPCWQPGQLPPWLKEFVEHCFCAVPFYRRYGDPPENFFDLPTADRSDLNHEPWAFVPDAQPLDDLIVYNTSGTTGHPLDILTHPDTLALYLPLVQAALATRGIDLPGRAERVTIAQICFQQRTYTCAGVLAALDQAGFVKLNLNPADWRDPADRARFLDACQAQIFTGDPLSFNELMQLPLTARPRALVSTAMTLLPGLRQALENRFGCPVLDVYSMNETGPLAVAAETGGTWALLQPRMYVEILDADGAPCPPGVRGEVTLSGGFNPFLPLLRYRTNDYASLEFRGARPVLVGLEGRPPTVFRAVSGGVINNIDISLALRPYAIARYALHQSADGALTLRVRGSGVDVEVLRQALLGLFGAGQLLAIEMEASFVDGAEKMVQYTCDL